jgi:hypothetical protein
VEDAQHHEPLLAILENVRGAQDFQDELPILLTSGERPANPRMSRENLRSGNDLFSNHCGKLGRLIVQERGESIEVSEGVIRPFELY